MRVAEIFRTDYVQIVCVNLNLKNFILKMCNENVVKMYQENISTPTKLFFRNFKNHSEIL